VVLLDDDFFGSEDADGEEESEATRDWAKRRTESLALGRESELNLKPKQGTLLRAGTLMKRSQLVKSWRDRYVELRTDALRYFDKKGGRCKGEIPLGELIEVKTEVFKGKGDGGLHLRSLRPNQFVLVSYALNMHLAASSEADLHAWVKAIENQRQERLTDTPPEHRSSLVAKYFDAGQSASSTGMRAGPAMGALGGGDEDEDEEDQGGGGGGAAFGGSLAAPSRAAAGGGGTKRRDSAARRGRKASADGGRAGREKQAASAMAAKEQAREAQLAAVTMELSLVKTRGIRELKDLVIRWTPDGKQPEERLKAAERALRTVAEKPDLIDLARHTLAFSLTKAQLRRLLAESGVSSASAAYLDKPELVERVLTAGNFEHPGGAPAAQAAAAAFPAAQAAAPAPAPAPAPVPAAAPAPEAKEKEGAGTAAAGGAAKRPGGNPMMNAPAGGGGGKADKARLHPTRKMTHEVFVALQRGVDDDVVEEKAERMRAIEEATAVYQFTCKQLDDLLAAMDVKAEQM
jgi:hypothetical protein